ncbi:FAD-dependent oxidoreductase [Deinococcus sonorensis]|uniref:FAD-dependent oxidoreductase n=2 Tax=Deinococcus sonorensis TaxID=309891 RepID=A0AAU7U8V4_9DEIO
MFTPDLPPRSQPQPGHLYDLAVVGAGLAGCEVAWRLARAGQDVLLVSQALDHLGNLYQPDLAGVSFPAGSLFAQVAQEIQPHTDGWVFHRALKQRLEATSGIHLLQSCVTAISEETGRVQLSTWEGPTLQAGRAVLAVGAFLKARLLLGTTMEDAGRLSEVAYDFLADDLQAQGLWLMPAEASAAARPGTPGYEVRYLSLGAGELDGFAVRRFDHVYALGQMVGGVHSYASVLQDAARLAAELGAS